MEIPLESDWKSQSWGFDTKYAYDHFNGLSLLEAQELVASRVGLYYEDFMHMPVICFKFYFKAFVDYLCSPNSEGESSAPDYFFSILECRDVDINEDPELKKIALQGLNYVREEEQTFGSCYNIYGSINDRARCLSLKFRA